MIAKTILRLTLALLALAAWAATPIYGQERPSGERAYEIRPIEVRPTNDRRYDEREYGPREATPADPGATQGGERQTAAQKSGLAIAQPRPAAPFQLDAQQQRFIDELLAAWEKHSAGIKTFECDFTRWEYSPTFVPVDANGQLKATAISSGEMKYIKPDKGLFHVTDTRILNKTTGKYEKASDDVGEHWVCDGKVVWEVDAKFKQVKENPIPPEMQGEQIANGPLPFMLFGGEAAKLKARYFMREQTHPQFEKEEIWLESYPRWAEDAANFKSAHLIMKRADFLPYALRMYSPNGTDYTVYEFRKIKINNVFMGDIKRPKVPSDYQVVRAQQQTAQQGPAAPPRQ